MPHDWPRDAIVHADDPARIPPVEIIAPHVRRRRSFGGCSTPRWSCNASVAVAA